MAKETTKDGKSAKTTKTAHVLNLLTGPQSGAGKAPATEPSAAAPARPGPAVATIARPDEREVEREIISALEQEWAESEGIQLPDGAEEQAAAPENEMAAPSLSTAEELIAQTLAAQAPDAQDISSDQNTPPPAQDTSPAQGISPTQDAPPTQDVSPVQDASPAQDTSLDQGTSPVQDTSITQATSLDQSASPSQATSPAQVSPAQATSPAQASPTQGTSPDQSAQALAQATPSTQGASSPADQPEVPISVPTSKHAFADISCINVMQALVEEKVDKYIKLFGMCTCSRCRIDVMALALTNLPAKYVVVKKHEMIPMLTVYEGRYNATVISQIMWACQKVITNPRHDL